MRHPKHLKGREIGMWYAKQTRERKAREGLDHQTPEDSTKASKIDALTRSTVSIGEQQRSQLKNLLRDLKKNPISYLPSTSSQGFEQQYKAHLSGNIDSSVKAAVLEGHCPQLNESIKTRWMEKMETEEFQTILESRTRLPIFPMYKEIVRTIEENPVVVISGETGCGKTTQLTQFVLDHYISQDKASLCNIICTQPRRISAISVAERVAEERCEKLGDSVGYQIRLEAVMPRTYGSILYCTTGILLQKMKDNKFLKGVSHIFLDEVHERDLDTDFLMIILKDILLKRPDLHVILMSATINASLFSQYFNHCPMVKVPGFTHPVTKLMLEDAINEIRYTPSFRARQKTDKWKRKRKSQDQQQQQEEEVMQAFLRSLEKRYSYHTVRVLERWDEENIDLDFIAQLTRHICQTKPDGAILIFLPGWTHISSLHKLLNDDSYFRHSRALIIPLHSLMPTINQREVFNRPPPGVRKIVLATNIAETSITIDDVVYVIDSGKIKISNYNEKMDLATLKPEWISLANAQQRRGRAGRVQPGVCYHLLSSARESLLPKYLLPEMLRTRLETLCLKIKILNLGRIEPFLSKAIEPPSPRTLLNSINLLKTLNALDDEENLTPLGFHLARLPLDPQTGKMILFGAIFSCLDPILTVAASLSFKDAFIMPLGKEKQVDQKKKSLAEGSLSDHIMLVKAFQGWETAKKYGSESSYCFNNFLSNSTLRMLSNLRSQFGDYLKDLHFLDSSNVKDPKYNKNSNNLDLIRAIVCAGLYPNVAKIVPRKPTKRMRPPRVMTKKHHRVSFHPKSVNNDVVEFSSQYLVYYTMVQSTEIYLHDTTCVNPYALLFFGGKIQAGREANKETVTVDDWVVFNCSKPTSLLIKDLRHALDELLEYKSSHPGVTQWETEGRILQPIIDLITTSPALAAPSDLVDYTSYEDEEDLQEMDED